MAADLMGVAPGSQGSTALSDGSEVEMPLLTYRAATFAAFFTISAAKARALLPSCEIRPVRVSPRRALVSIQVMEYTEKNIEPYRELAFSIPVQRADGMSVPGVSLATWLNGAGSASYITHLAVDNVQALLVGREVLGFPKFLAEIEIAETATERIAEASLDGESILTLAVAKAKSHKPRRREFSIYTLSPDENKLFHIPYQSEASTGVAIGPRAARLHLGSHPVAAELRDLGLAPSPLFALDIPQYTLISNRPDAKLEVGEWRDPRSLYCNVRQAARGGGDPAPDRAEPQELGASLPMPR